MKAHFESLPAVTRNVFTALAGQRIVEPFYLAGGTALALHFGHRISADLDLFCEQPFNEQALITALSTLDEFTLEQHEEGTVHSIVAGAKVSFFHYPYPMLEATRAVEGIDVAGVRDIGCMKLEAVSRRGTKRDFIDLYVIVRRLRPLNDLLRDYEEKYKKLNVNILHIKKSLTYFDDAEGEPHPRMLDTSVDWDAVKSFFLREAKRLAVP